MKVRNLKRNGRNVSNQFEIRICNRFYFQSYECVVACVDIGDNQVTLTNNWKYSPTKLKYLKQFLNEHGYNVTTKSDIQNKLNLGVFKLFEYDNSLTLC